MHGKTGTVTGDSQLLYSHDINLSSTPCTSLTVSNLQYYEHQNSSKQMNFTSNYEILQNKAVVNAKK
jgi:hypothetical protein